MVLALPLEVENICICSCCYLLVTSCCDKSGKRSLEHFLDPRFTTQIVKSYTNIVYLIN